MVAKVKPEAKLVFGRFNGDLESSLRDYNPEFVKDVDCIGIDYMLFKREDPSLLSVFQTHDFSNVVGITVVSYDESLNEKIFAEVINKIGVVPVEGPGGELLGVCRKGLKEIYTNIFSRKLSS